MAITAAEHFHIQHKGNMLEVNESKLNYFWKNPERPFCQTYIRSKLNALAKRNIAQMK